MPLKTKGQLLTKARSAGNLEVGKGKEIQLPRASKRDVTMQTT
jgi:hypothetical protein